MGKALNVLWLEDLEFDPFGNPAIYTLPQCPICKAWPTYYEPECPKCGQKLKYDKEATREE